MPRDRKQRARQRRAREAAKRPPEDVKPPPEEVKPSPEEEHSGQLVRSDLPGSLDHASGDVDEFDAALVRGAGGVPLPEDQQLTPEDFEAQVQEGVQGGGEAASLAGALGSPRVAAPVEAHRPKGNRIIAFLGASWAELQRVQWPDRHEVFQATAVVLGFVVVAGVYLGAADWVAQKIVNFIL